MNNFLMVPVSVISFGSISSPMLANLCSSSAVRNGSDSFFSSTVDKFSSPINFFNRFSTVDLPLLPEPYSRSLF